jgi:hypothetical protein
VGDGFTARFLSEIGQATAPHRPNSTREETRGIVALEGKRPSTFGAAGATTYRLENTISPRAFPPAAGQNR